MESDSRNISEEEIEHISWLARIEITAEEKKRFTRQFNIILDYFRVIDQADTTLVKPSLYVYKVTNVFRDDNVEKSLSTEEALANALKTKGGYFQAPKIV